MFDSLSSTLNALKHKQVSSVELTQHYLQQIEKNQHLNAFIAIDAENALTQAKQADSLLHNKQAKRLTGLPAAHKDIFCTQTMNTTCGSKMLADFKAPYQATIVNKLAEQGVITLGKTNMDEFAMGSANENSYFGAVKNPWDNNCVAGGSSGGSAAAVAAGLVPFATASDTGGSIRQPAAFCGVSGIKPTYGLVSRYGMIAYASSLDQAGIIAQSAEDLALLLSIIAGFDALDSTSLDRPIPDYNLHLHHSLKDVRIGLPTCFFTNDLAPSIQNAISEAVNVFKQAGAVIVDVELKLQPLWVPCYYVIACAEASSNLARYDGIRYGYRSKQNANIKTLITASRSEAFGEEVKRRIFTGTYVLSSGYFDAYYLQALKIRRLIQQELINCFHHVDVLLGPTTPTCAFPLGQKNKDPVTNYLADVFTVAANLAGLPAMSIPAGFANQLPIGMQLMGNYFSEQRLLSAAHQYQLLTTWHKTQAAVRK